MSQSASTARLKLEPGQHVHFIGIGGVSMSALALALHEKGFHITGSDKADSATVKRLRAADIPVARGQAAANVGGADVIVYTTAICEDNPELIAARDSNRPVVHRAELIAYLVDKTERIAVAGTHGKTTTTAMLGTIFVELGYDPTVFVGGHCYNLDSNFRQGEGSYAIFEACESDSSFLAYKRCSQVLTSIEPDHLDTHGTFAHLRQSFADFVKLANPEGFVAYWAESEEVCRAVTSSPARLISYGINPGPDITAAAVSATAQGISFTPVVFGEPLPSVNLQVIGRHHVLNALAALAAACGAGLPPTAAAEALGKFAGVKRRFECLGRVNGYLVVDDYAHHPTEIRAMLQAAREHFDSRIVAVFQPHLYSRTEYLMEDFAQSFDQADVVGITEIYAAREQPRDDVNARQLYERIRARQPDKQVAYLRDVDEVVAFLRDNATSEDLVITIGAGDIRRAAEQLVATV